MSHDDHFRQKLTQTGQVASFQDLEKLILEFEQVLSRHGVRIQSGSELEGACCSVLEVLGKNLNAAVCHPREDIRGVFTEVLGIWIFLKKVARLKEHPSLAQFVPHLNLLNKGTVVQNRRVRACQDATNKIFELLFGLVLLDVSADVQLAHPDFEDTSNPDILATIDGQRWGFACKTLYGASGKTLFDNLKKGADQIEVSSAQIGCVMVNLRNLLSHEAYWPILNETEYGAGGEPVFAAYTEPENIVAPKLWETMLQKRDQVVSEVGQENILNFFAAKKALPAFLAFAQTCSGKATTIGPIPTSIITLGIGTFGDVQAHQGVFERINMALHERVEGKRV